MKKQKTEGFLIASILVIMIAVLFIAYMTVQASERTTNKVRIEQMQISYLAESLLDIQNNLLSNKFNELTDLSVLYAKAETPLGELVTIPIESSFLFKETEDELNDITNEALSVIKKIDGNKRSVKSLDMKTDVIIPDKNDLMIHKLDENGVFHKIDDNTEGILSPIELKSIIYYTGGSISVVFQIEDIKFETISNSIGEENSYGIITLKLNTDEIKINIQSFRYE